VTPLLILGGGLAVLAVGGAALASFGRRYRIGRLLAAAPAVSVAEAVQIATAGDPRYVRIQGRIDSDRDFEDADHRPLVARRTRIDTRSGALGRWRTVEDGLEVVPFRLNEGLDTIAIDEGDLRAGLVVVPRLSVGTAADLGDRLPTETPPETPTRVTIEQISSVEHAIALGRPVLDPDGEPRLVAGLGRPLVVTTLEVPEAMRILTGGAVGRSRLAAVCLVVGAGLVIVGAMLWAIGWILTPAVALAASSVPSILPGADTRSSGEGPGLVGNPALAVFGVVGVGLLAVLATLLYVRLTAGRRE
jgi:hypothetical protein